MGIAALFALIGTAAAGAAETTWSVFADPLSSGAMGPSMVVIERGHFTMGSPTDEEGRLDDERQHTLEVPRFAMSRTEVSFESFARYTSARGIAMVPRPRAVEARNPVVSVALRHARGYARWLSTETGHNYRLPTEAQWEFAARAGEAAARHWGAGSAVACEYANVHDLRAQRVAGQREGVHPCSDGNVRVAATGQYRANAFGLYDMLGNVWEWTCSPYSANYDGSETRCARHDEPQDFRIVRGGSWQDEPRWVRSAARLRVLPSDRDVNIGFRVVRELKDGETLPGLRQVDPAEDAAKPRPGAPKTAA